MRFRRITITPGGALLLGALVFLLDGAALSALFAACAAHELGHVLALWLLGARLEGVSVAATGPILYCGAPKQRLDAAITALAGPFFGALFFLAFSKRWTLAAEMSAVLTAVNLLPVLPLDGGRALFALLSAESFARTLMRAVRIGTIAVLYLIGAYCAFKGKGPALLLFALWLTAVPDDTCKTVQDDVKYSYS